ncbi:MAG: STAS domain-containing protein [Desulfobacterales bacterium]|nr:STAS domain-containing protein [Desulfobacterales bacterium]
MPSTITREGSTIIVKPGRDVVASMANEFRDELHAIIQKGPKELIIDLSGVEMVDSVGIGVLIATHNSLSKVGGQLKVINVAKDIYGLFTTMRLDRHFTVKSA